MPIVPSTAATEALKEQSTSTTQTATRSTTQTATRSTTQTATSEIESGNSKIKIGNLATSDTADIVNSFYQVWKVAYINGSIADSNLIDGNNFSFAYNSLIAYGTYDSADEAKTSSSGTVVLQMNSNNTNIDYNLVSGNTSDVGSYLVKVTFQQGIFGITSIVEDGYYYLSAENGGTARPTFANENTEPNVSDPNDIFDMLVGFDVQYSEAETTAIQNKWANETFEENFTNFIDTYTNEMYNFSPTSEEVTFRFNKTTPMKEKTQSALAGQAATTTTTVSTSTSVSVSPTTSTSTGTY